MFTIKNNSYFLVFLYNQVQTKQNSEAWWELYHRTDRLLKEN